MFSNLSEICQWDGNDIFTVLMERHHNIISLAYIFIMPLEVKVKSKQGDSTQGREKSFVSLSWTVSYKKVTRIVRLSCTYSYSSWHMYISLFFLIFETYYLCLCVYAEERTNNRKVNCENKRLSQRPFVPFFLVCHNFRYLLWLVISFIFILLHLLRT